MSKEESQDQAGSSENEQPQYAVSIDDLFWASGDTEDEAIENAREQIEEVDVNDLDLTVVDHVEEGL